MGEWMKEAKKEEELHSFGGSGSNTYVRQCKQCVFIKSADQCGEMNIINRKINQKGLAFLLIVPHKHRDRALIEAVFNLGFFSGMLPSSLI